MDPYADHDRIPVASVSIRIYSWLPLKKSLRKTDPGRTGQALAGRANKEKLRNRRTAVLSA